MGVNFNLHWCKFMSFDPPQLPSHSYWFQFSTLTVFLYKVMCSLCCKKISNFPRQQRDHNHRYTSPTRNQLQKLYPHSKSDLFYRYTLPGRQHFSRFAMPALYNELVKQVKCELLGAKWFATTTDMWTSRSTIPYMALTVHWIDDNFELHSRALQVHN